MADIPMLFQGSMVHAMLAIAPLPGNHIPLKRRTRRGITKRNTFYCGRPWHPTDEPRWHAVTGILAAASKITPRAKVGDRILVRETWARHKGQVVFRAQELPPRSVRWRPGIHLEHKHVRIALPLTGVRFECLQNISREDLLAEGVTCHDIPMGKGQPSRRVTFYSDEEDLRRAFAHLWDSINGPGAWKANPFVIVYEWEKLEILSHGKS